jgi:hypothetical protein
MSKGISGPLELGAIVCCVRKSTAAFRRGYHYRIISIEPATCLPTFRYVLEPIEYQARPVKTSCRHIIDHFKVGYDRDFHRSIVPEMPSRSFFPDSSLPPIKRLNPRHLIASRDAAIHSVMRHQAFVQFGER